MPTYGWVARFRADFAALDNVQQAAFLLAAEQFVADLKAGAAFRKGLRVKGVKGATGIFEMTWTPNGRATFQYGEQIIDGEPHVVWRRLGTHDVFGRP